MYQCIWSLQFSPCHSVSGTKMTTWIADAWKSGITNLNAFQHVHNLDEVIFWKRMDKRVDLNWYLSPSPLLLSSSFVQQ